MEVFITFTLINLTHYVINMSLTVIYCDKLTFCQVIEDIRKMVESLHLTDSEKWVTVMFDEMKIQADLVSII